MECVICAEASRASVECSADAGGALRRLCRSHEHLIILNYNNKNVTVKHASKISALKIEDHGTADCCARVIELLITCSRKMFGRVPENMLNWQKNIGEIQADIE